jgi:acyl carrier protein
MNPGEVHALIAEVLGIDIGRVKENLAFGELPEWDSLNHVNLMVALEERLGVEIGPDEIVELDNVAVIEKFALARSRSSACWSASSVSSPSFASSTDEQAANELHLDGPAAGSHGRSARLTP